MLLLHPFFFSASSLDLACCSFLSSLSFSMLRTFFAFIEPCTWVIRVFFFENLGFTCQQPLWVHHATAASSCSVLAFVLFLIITASALVEGFYAENDAAWYTENLGFIFLLITEMKNISFKVSTDKFIAQNIIIQLDH